MKISAYDSVLKVSCPKTQHNSGVEHSTLPQGIFYISAKNKDNDMKPSGYDPWGPPRSSMVSRMTLSSMSTVRNPQCSPSTPILYPLPPS